jgi:hypothetical protein
MYQVCFGVSDSIFRFEQTKVDQSLSERLAEQFVESGRCKIRIQTDGL